MPTAASTNPASTIGSRPPPPARARSEGAPAQRHEQEQQHVVDGHHGADEGAMVAQRVAHEERDEGAEQRTGDTGKEAAEADEQGGEIRGA